MFMHTLDNERGRRASFQSVTNVIIQMCESKWDAVAINDILIFIAMNAVVLSFVFKF